MSSDYAFVREMERKQQHDDAMKEMFGPYVESFIEYMKENGMAISEWIAFVVIGLATFNAVAHCIVAVLMLTGAEAGKKVWSNQALNRQFEKPGSGLKYLLTGPAWELGSLIYYMLSTAEGASVHVYAFQLFAIGGGEMYNQLKFSNPPIPDRHFFQVFCVELVFLFGMLCDQRVPLLYEQCFIAYAGCKGLGYLWAGCVVVLLDKFDIARFAKLDIPPEPEDEPAAAAGANAANAATGEPLASSAASSASDAAHAKKD